MRSMVSKAAIVALLLGVPLAFASWSENDNWTTGSLNGGWTINVPSTATVLYSRVAASTPPILGAYADVQAGISGPPSGVIHVARVISNGGSTLSDDKRDYNHPAGSYTVWHGGGTDGTYGSMITAYTEIDW